MKFKKILCVLALMVFAGCQANTNSEIEESKEPFTVQLFYSKTCPHCKQLKENLLPAIEEAFGSQVTIEQYDIDEDKSIELYDSYIGIYDPETESWEKEGLLEGVDEDSASRNYYIPLMVIGDYYAFMGYTESLKDAYIQDMHLALQGRKLATGDVEAGRWLFRNEE